MKFKGYLVGAVALLVLCLGSTANAQITTAPGDFFIIPRAGIDIPVGDFGDAADIGIFGGASADYMLAENVAVGADLVANFFGGKDLGSGYKSTSRIIQIGGHGKYLFAPGETINPFAFAGLGIYNIHVKATLPYLGESSDSKSYFGANIGGGVMFKATDAFDVALQATLHDIFSEHSSSQYIDLGGALVFKLGGK